MQNKTKNSGPRIPGTQNSGDTIPNSSSRPVLDRVADFVAFIAAQGGDLSFAAIRAAEQAGRPLGTADFIEGLERVLGRRIARRAPGRKPAQRDAEQPRMLRAWKSLFLSPSCMARCRALIPSRGFHNILNTRGQLRRAAGPARPANRVGKRAP